MTPVTGKGEAAAAVADDVVEAPRRGRPRATDRTPTILRAVIELVDEAGYDHLRIQDVADRAGVGLATIYRRWPTKQALFIDALRNKTVDLPDTGDVRADLVAIFERMAAGLQPDKGQLVPGCLAVGRDEPEILEALRDNALCAIRDHLRRLIAGVVGEDDPDLELRVDMAPGILLHRGMLYGEAIEDRAVLERMADLVLLKVPDEPS